MGTPLFSFIMPAYKRQFLANAIESILAQTYGDFELVVVNDASPENLREIVMSYHDPRLRYEENAENIGGKDLVACWNHCLQFARGEWVILATDDDVMEPVYLENTVHLLKKHPDVDLLRHGVRKIDTNGQPLEYELFPAEMLTASEFAYFWACCGLISCISNFVFRRYALQDMGGFIAFPHAHFSDVATALAMSKNGIACVHAFNLSFRMSDINLSNTRDWRLVIDQIEASSMFMEWLDRHLITIGSDFFSNRAYYGYRNNYRLLMEILISKIPKTKFTKTLTILARSRYLYKKEKLKLFLAYIL